MIKTEGRRPEGHVTDPRNVRKEKMSRTQIRMAAAPQGVGSRAQKCSSTINGWLNLGPRFLTLIYITVHIRE